MNTSADTSRSAKCKRIVSNTCLCVLLVCVAAWSAAADNVNYTLTIRGVDDNALKSALRKASLLVRLADNRPENRRALERRIQNDVGNFRKTLREHGYYSAKIKHMTGQDEQTASIIFRIDKGRRYRIKDYTLKWADGQDKPDNVTIPEMPVGAPAVPDTILASEDKLINALRMRGYPFPEVRSRKLYLDHDTAGVSVQLLLHPGPEAVFGATEVKGLKRLDESFVKRRIAWRKGERFALKKIVTTRKTLTRTSVISQVDIDFADIDDNGTLPVTMTVKERKHRTIGAGVNYDTALGLTGSVFWEHRNLSGEAEQVRLRAGGGNATRAFEADYIQPDFWDDLRLVWENTAAFRQEFLEAFDKDTAVVRTALNYQYSDVSSLSGGISIEYNRIREKGQAEEDNFSLLSLPVQYRYDITRDILDPRDGMRFRLGFIPQYVVNDREGFVTTDADVSHYLPIGEDFVLASRARAAVIYGPSRADIPADKRLYSGGGGSVRGYAYQLLGPLDDDDNPLGGKTAFEIGTEGRYAITETIEGVAFVEGGRVTEDIELNSDSGFLWAGGVGARYHSVIGPVRLDVAVPFNKRRPDSPFQLYISIGQAF